MNIDGIQVSFFFALSLPEDCVFGTRDKVSDLKKTKPLSVEIHVAKAFF
jgi:hypothetical protein